MADAFVGDLGGSWTVQRSGVFIADSVQDANAVGQFDSVWIQGQSLVTDPLTAFFPLAQQLFLGDVGGSWLNSRIQDYGAITVRISGRIYLIDGIPVVGSLLRLVPILSESVKPLVDALKFGGRIRRRVRLIEQDAEVPAFGYSYSTSDGQLGQISLTVDGDQRDLFPPDQVVPIEVVAEIDGVEVPEARMEIWRGGSVTIEPTGITTQLQGRSLGASLLDPLSVSLQPEGIPYLRAYSNNRPSERIDNSLTDLIEYLCRRAGFAGGVFSDLPVKRVGQVTLIDVSPWQVIQEIAQLWGCVATIDDRMGMLRITNPYEQAIDRSTVLTGVGEQIKEENTTDQFFNAVVVQGVSYAPEGARNQILRTRRILTELVEAPDRRPDPNTGAVPSTQRVSTTETTRVLLGRRPINTASQTTVVFQDPQFSFYDSQIFQSERWEYTPDGQEDRYQLERLERAVFNRTLPAVIGTQGATLYGFGPKHYEAFSLLPGGGYRRLDLDLLKVQLGGREALWVERTLAIPATAIGAELVFACTINVSLTTSNLNTITIATTQE